MTTVEVLRKARALYAANPSHEPWPNRVRHGLHCAITAISDAAPAKVDFVPARMAVARGAGVDDSKGKWLAIWNATHSTEEVLAAFDRAIEAEERAA